MKRDIEWFLLFYSDTWPSYLMYLLSLRLVGVDLISKRLAGVDLISLRLVGAVEAGNYAKSSFSVSAHHD